MLDEYSFDNRLEQLFTNWAPDCDSTVSMASENVSVSGQRSAGGF